MEERREGHAGTRILETTDGGLWEQQTERGAGNRWPKRGGPNHTVNIRARNNCALQWGPQKMLNYRTQGPSLVNHWSRTVTAAREREGGRERKARKQGSEER